MKVADLISKLEKLDPEASVYVFDYELGWEPLYAVNLNLGTVELVSEVYRKV